MHVLAAVHGVPCPARHAKPPQPCTAAVPGCDRAAALQAFLSRDCPLLQRVLPARLRLLFAAGTLSYAAAAAATPLFAAVPVVAVAGGVFPLALTPRLVAAAVPYFLAQHAGAAHLLAGALGACCPACPSEHLEVHYAGLVARGLRCHAMEPAYAVTLKYRSAGAFCNMRLKSYHALQV